MAQDMPQSQKPVKQIPHTNQEKKGTVHFEPIFRQSSADFTRIFHESLARGQDIPSRNCGVSFIVRADEIGPLPSPNLRRRFFLGPIFALRFFSCAWDWCGTYRQNRHKIICIVRSVWDQTDVTEVDPPLVET
jgi:hypothetical protein